MNDAGAIYVEYDDHGAVATALAGASDAIHLAFEAGRET
jgi:hypothetical protein